MDVFGLLMIAAGLALGYMALSGASPSRQAVREDKAAAVERRIAELRRVAGVEPHD